MSLVNQFQGLLGSLFIGFFLSFILHIWNTIFESKKIYILFPLYIIFFSLCSVLYISFLFNTTKGVNNIFFIPVSIYGGFLYEKYYYPHFDVVFCKVKNKARLKMHKMIDIIIKRGKRKNGDISKKEE